MVKRSAVQRDPVQRHFAQREVVHRQLAPGQDNPRLRVRECATSDLGRCGLDF